MTTLMQFLINGICTGAIYALIAIGFVLVYKATRVLNFAQGGMVAMGAFILWACLAQLGFPVWLSLILTIGLGAAMGLLIERFTMRPLIGQPIMASVMVTLALLGGLRGLILLVWASAERSFPVDIIPRGVWHVAGLYLSQVHIYSFIATMILILLLTLYFQFTRSGLAMRVTAEDHTIAQSLGVKVKRVFSNCWLIVGVIAVIGGIFLASTAMVTEKLDMIALRGLAVMLLGGLESIPGAVIAGIIVGVAETLAAGYLASYIGGGIGEVFPYMLMILVLLIRPYGLFGLVRIERI